MISRSRRIGRLWRRRWFLCARKFGLEYPLTIGGEKVTTKEKIQSTNPSKPSEVIGIFQKATVEMANQAVERRTGI